MEDDERQYVQDNPGSKVVVLGHVPDLDAWFMNRQRDYDEFARKANAYPLVYCETDVDKLQADPGNKRVWKDGNGIITVTPKDGKQYWIDSMNGRKIFSRPTMCRQRGKASHSKESMSVISILITTLTQRTSMIFSFILSIANMR